MLNSSQMLVIVLDTLYCVKWEKTMFTLNTKCGSRPRYSDILCYIQIFMILYHLFANDHVHRKEDKRMERQTDVPVSLQLYGNCNSNIKSILFGANIYHAQDCAS